MVMLIRQAQAIGVLPAAQACCWRIHFQSLRLDNAASLHNRRIARCTFRLLARGLCLLAHWLERALEIRTRHSTEFE